MLENRPFDSMLGMLYPSDGTFEGLTGLETNIFAGRPVRVWKSDTMDAIAASIPDPDPGELFTDMNAQLFSGQVPVTPATMNGFAANYMTQARADSR